MLAAHTGAVLDLKVQGNRVVSGSMDKTADGLDCCVKSLSSDRPLVTRCRQTRTADFSVFEFGSRSRTYGSVLYGVVQVDVVGRFGKSS